MSTGSRTYEATNEYTVADIKRVVDRFAADFYMIGMATGLRTREQIAKTVSDIKIYAEAEYLQSIDVTLFDTGGSEVKAVQYRVSNNAGGWTNQQPGNNLWPYSPTGTLKITISMSTSWFKLTEAQRIRFDEFNGLTWPDGNRDLSHSTLIKQFDRQYASNGYGMEKNIYGA